MKVTRLRLHGFKSFVEGVEVPIQPGLTGIVGPNGCGKSNLVEALRFVMGESSYKAMRGGGMDDVIFAGSSDRPARNMAEVTLVAERDGRQGPETLEITRHIERDGGSTYKLNGKEARARDVQLLFADAATGAHSSALVRQGQVAELIAAKPVQRRGILEDAAGISGLHARRNEAEGKLKAAEGNIERLDDVMAEIGSRLDGLRRQARQAVRYRKISGEIRKAEAALYLLNWETTIARLADAERDFTAAMTAFAAATARQMEAARDEAVAAHRLPELRERAAAAAAALQHVRVSAEALDREEAQLKARREDLSARRVQAAADLQHESDIGSDAAAASARLDEAEASLRREGAEAAGRIAAARARASEAAAAAADADAEFSVAAGAFAAAAAERAGRERATREAHARLLRLEEERKSVLAQRDRLFAEHGGAAATKGTAEAVAQGEALLAHRENEAQGAEAALAHARETERRARAPYEAAERNLGALQAEARTLAELLDLEKTRRFPPLIDHLDVSPGYEQALVAALGDDLSASLDFNAPAYWATTGPADRDPALPAGAEALATFVRGPEVLQRRLQQVGVVVHEQAAAMLPRLAAGQRLVTREGALWRWDGLRAEPGSAAAGARRLEQRNRVAFLVQELKSARASVEKAGALFETAKQLRADAESLEADSRGAVRQARQALDKHRQALGEAERRASRISERLSAFAGALARIEADTDATRTELKAAAEALSGLADTAELAVRRDAAQAVLAERRGKAAETALDAERAIHEERSRAGRAADLVVERDRWKARLARAEERTRELKSRLERLDAELAALADDPAAIGDRRRKLLASAEAAEKAAASAADAVAAAETEHREAAKRARDALESLAQTREKRARDEERKLAGEARKGELTAQIREQFGRPVEELRALAGLAPNAPLPTAAAIESRLQKLRTERERLGSVNLRADEEAREIEARLDAMRAERDDLEAAIKRLRHAIQSLNSEGRERLLAAFEAVNGHFRSLFQHLFGGGTAELTLTGSEDPLEAGLDIVARPPGKRPHAMTLLSGGEQALTALSLIFAVFLTNPSPICVLDEVDAPLDDANVERFCALLDDMRNRTETRFVVVTHNPITMARMDRLFGITMAERGVSQVVSVDLEAAERFREAS